MEEEDGQRRLAVDRLLNVPVRRLVEQVPDPLTPQLPHAEAGTQVATHPDRERHLQQVRAERALAHPDGVERHEHHAVPHLLRLGKLHFLGVRVPAARLEQLHGAVHKEERVAPVDAALVPLHVLVQLVVPLPKHGPCEPLTHVLARDVLGRKPDEPRRKRLLVSHAAKTSHVPC